MVKNFESYKKTLDFFEKQNKTNDEDELLMNFQLFKGIEVDEINKKVFFNPNQHNNIDAPLEIKPVYAKINGIDMAQENNGIFSYSYIKPADLRKHISSSVKDSYIGNELLVSPKINNKSILILDDSVSTGQSISEICKNIIHTYTPESITVITLFNSL